MIEADHPRHPGAAEVQGRRDRADGIFRNVPEFRLNLMQDGQECAFAIGPPGENIGQLHTDAFGPGTVNHFFDP